MRKYVLLLIFLVLMGLLAFIGTIWREGPQQEVPELTAARKREDFEYLAKLVKEVYPLDKALEQDKDLENMDVIGQAFITRAGESADNAEFLRLFYEYMTFLGQAGHAQVVFDEPYNPMLAFFYNIDKQAYRSRDYWLNMAAGVEMYVHSKADIHYEQGKYVLAQDYQARETLFPQGSIIERINGLDVEDYVKSLQTRLHLVWDAALHRVYLQTLLSADPGNGAWMIEAVRPDGMMAKGDFLVYKGYAAPYRNEQPDSNVIPVELDDQTGYIRIFSFADMYKEQDRLVIQDFMKKSGGKYSKLIIDLRRNGGGDDDYWADNLLKPLLKAPVDYEQSASVKKSFGERFGLRFRLYKQFVSSTLTNKDRYDVTEVKKEQLPGVDSADWDTYTVTKYWQPEDSFLFDGKVYVLADGDSFSAADNFTAAVRKLGLGTVAGTNTAGGACVYMEPYRYALPNSGIIFKLETDLNSNAEGRINEIYGTAPDVLMDESRYPTAYPESYEPEVLKNEEWIRKVMLGL